MKAVFQISFCSDPGPDPDPDLDRDPDRDLYQ